MDLYLQELMPGITEPGDDNNYGSAAMQDVLCLQALSKRIHYGKFVAEAKYRAHPEQYEQLIQNRDHDAIMSTLTNEDVEKKVCSMCNGGSCLLLMLCSSPCTAACIITTLLVHQWFIRMIVNYQLKHRVFCIRVSVLDSLTQSYREFVVVLCPASHRLAMPLHQLMFRMHRLWWKRHRIISIFFYMY